MATSLTAIRSALADARTALARISGNTTCLEDDTETVERGLMFGEIAADNLARLGAELDAAHAKVGEWRIAATYTEGPEECLDRDCEEFSDGEGNDNGQTSCSHLTHVSFTPEQVADILVRHGDLSAAHAILRRLEAAESWSEINQIFSEYTDHRERDGAVPS